MEEQVITKEIELDTELIDRLERTMARVDESFKKMCDKNINGLIASYATLADLDTMMKVAGDIFPAADKGVLLRVVYSASREMIEWLRDLEDAVEAEVLEQFIAEEMYKMETGDLDLDDKTAVIRRRFVGETVMSMDEMIKHVKSEKARLSAEIEEAYHKETQAE